MKLSLTITLFVLSNIVFGQISSFYFNYNILKELKGRKIFSYQKQNDAEPILISILEFESDQRTAKEKRCNDSICSIKFTKYNLKGDTVVFDSYSYIDSSGVEVLLYNYPISYNNYTYKYDPSDNIIEKETQHGILITFKNQLIKKKIGV